MPVLTVGNVGLPHSVERVTLLSNTYRAGDAENGQGTSCRGGMRYTSVEEYLAHKTTPPPVDHHGVLGINQPTVGS